ncbi:hypothetical protein [Pseudonocardia sp.]|uniref:hypothetical protein n=1 Tax=Pseudonocardia sp. TaxID=60912 RepID=UPI003D0AEFC1
MSMPPGPQDPFDPRSFPEPPTRRGVGADPLVPGDFGGWLERIVGVVRRSWPALLPVQLVATAVGVGVGAAAGPPFDGAPFDPTTVGPDFLGTALLAGVIMLLVAAASAAVSVVLAVRHAAGDPLTVGQAAGIAGGRVLPLAGWLLVAGALVVAGTLLILPAIYLGVVFVASLYGVVVVERRGIGRCFALVNPRLLPTLGRILLAVGAYLAFLATVDLLVSAVGAGPLATTVVQVVAGSAVGVVGVAVAVVTYAELRAGEQPGLSTATLAAQLAG